MKKLKELKNKKIKNLYMILGIVIVLLIAIPIAITFWDKSELIGSLFFGLPILIGAALTADRITPERPNIIFRLPILASTKIYAGSIVVQDSSGWAKPGVTGTGLKSRGVAIEFIDNSAGANGDKYIRVKEGTFRFANSAGGDAITKADLENTCWIVDDQTVAKTSGTQARSVAGIIKDVDSDGVWVEFKDASLYTTSDVVTDSTGGTPSTTLAVVTNLDTLTDSTAGTADNTVSTVATAVQDIDLLVDSTAGTADNTVATMDTLTDTPATADALRDDLMATWFVTLNNNFKELTDQVISLKTTISDVNARLVSINNNFKEIVDQVITQKAANTSITNSLSSLATEFNELLNDIK